MNPKIVKLLEEGFSMKTIESFNNKQIDVLYERINKEEQKEVSTVTTTKTVYSPTEAKGKSFQGTTTVKPDGSVEVTKEGELEEKSVSKKQQQAMGIALAAKRGDIPKSKLKGASKEMAKMSEKDLEDFASTKHKGLPEKKKKETDEVKHLEESIIKLLNTHYYPQTTKTELLNTIKNFKK